MRSRIVTSGMMAVAAVAVLSLSVPAFAVEEEPVSTTSSLETVEQTTTVEQTNDDEDATTGTLDQVGDEVDDSVATVEDEVDGAVSGPEPVADTVDSTTDTTSDTTDAVTDTVQQSTEEPTDPDGSGTKDQRGAGDGPAPAPPPGTAPDGRALAGGGVPAPAPARVALDGFRRTSGGSAADLAVTADPVFEQEPAFAPPTTRDVADPPTAAPPLPLRTVAIEILVAAALLVMATGGLVAELGPERA